MQQRGIEVRRIERGAPSRIVLFALWLALGATFLLWLVWITS